MRSKVIALLTAGLLVVGCVGTGADMGPLVTRDRVRAIKVGMTQPEVRDILGEPISVDSLVWQNDETVRLTYTRHTLTARFHPMLWVHLRDGRVREVYAKRYGSWILDDDIGIYVLNAERRWESPVFERVFPQ